MFIFHPISVSPSLLNQTLAGWSARRLRPVGYWYGWWHLKRTNTPEASIGGFTTQSVTGSDIKLSPNLFLRLIDRNTTAPASPTGTAKQLSQPLRQAWSHFANWQITRGGGAFVLFMVILIGAIIAPASLAPWQQMLLIMLVATGILLLVTGLWGLIRGYYNASAVASWTDSPNRMNYYIFVDRQRLPKMSADAINAQLKAAAPTIGRVRLVSHDANTVYAGVHSTLANDHDIQAALNKAFGVPDAVRVTSFRITYVAVL